MPKINQAKLRRRMGTSYPAPFDKPCASRESLGLSGAGELTQFGVHKVTLPPGCWASQRHYHSAEDEFIYVLSGAPTLIDNDGETQLKAGDSTAHKAGDPNGHHLVNNSGADAIFLVVGSRNPSEDHCRYPDIDLDLPAIGRPGRKFTPKP